MEFVMILNHQLRSYAHMVSKHRDIQSQTSHQSSQARVRLLGASEEDMEDGCSDMDISSTDSYNFGKYCKNFAHAFSTHRRKCKKV